MRIGIDTGGTYTDAVLYRPSRSSPGRPEQNRGDRAMADRPEADPIVAKAKARTRVDLSIGIAEALDRVLAAAAPEDRSAIALVSLSTTLATNALVEGIGGRVALVFIGFTEAELERGGLREGLGDAPVIMAAGGHDSLGVEAAPFDAESLVSAAAELDVDAFAVAGQFSVRNPAHELAARDALAALGKPVACGHELSARLNGPKRALTCLLNAKLIGLIAELCRAAETILADRGIDAPLMIVRGDGSLVSAAFARDRPIETILSGPAASLIGAGHLTGVGDVVVADVGGTTTDVGVLHRGRPRVSTDGATVGGHQTMVEAVEMFTFGLGGDSEIRLDPNAPRTARPVMGSGMRGLLIGPRRVTPLSLLAAEEPELVHPTLDRRSFPYRPSDTTFAAVTGRDGSASARERKLLDAIGGRWVPLDDVATTNLETSALRSLVSRGLVRLAGFTPTDAAHVLELQAEWDIEAATKAAGLLAAAADESGSAVMPDAEAFSRWVVDSLIRQSAEAILAATLTVDGFPPSTVRSEPVQRILDGRAATVGPDRSEANPAWVTALSVGLSRPLAGLGAAAGTYYPGVARLLATPGLIPRHAEVANAIGAAVGMVRITGQTTVSQPSKGQFRIHLPEAGPDLGNLEPAIRLATELLSRQVEARADVAGAADLELEVDVERKTATVGGRELFVEATVTVTGVGEPRTV